LKIGAMLPGMQRIANFISTNQPAKHRSSLIVA
jgi:hypothetical protein